MPTFISDPPQWAYLLAFATAAITGLGAARNQDRRNLIRFGIALAVLLFLYLMDRAFESPREEGTRKVRAMAEAASAADPVRFIEHISPSFEMKGANRDKLKTSQAWDLIRAHRARIAVWGFGRDSYRWIDDGQLEIGFYTKAEAGSSGMVMRYAKARFVRDADGQFRVKTMTFYNPADGGLNAEDPIPGFP